MPPKLTPSAQLAPYRAVLFDLDGVLTPTATIHAACWKRVFDDFLSHYQAQTSRPIAPFDIQQDYLRYVDGKPRYDGVESFLAARQITLPYGDPQAPPNHHSVCGIGNSKDRYFSEVLHEQGISPFPGALALVNALREQGIKTAVVSSSRNCKEVLKVAEILDLFESIVDGKLAEQLELAGKPAPDTFLHAARELGCGPTQAVVIEDAIAGVQAGQNGQFGLVIGVASPEQAPALLNNGAHWVVADLSELLVNCQ